MNKTLIFIQEHKLRAFFLMAGLLLLLVLFFRLFFPLLVNPWYSLGDDLAEYKRTFCIFWNAKEPYAVFPEKDSIRASDSYNYNLYHEKFPALFFLVDDDILAVLECQFSEDDFNAEVVRLKELCGDANETDFAYPAFLYHTNARVSLEYALIDRENYTIHYISMQRITYAKRFVEPQYLPLSWHTINQ